MTFLNRAILMYIFFCNPAMSGESKEITVYGMVVDEKMKTPIAKVSVVVEKFQVGESAMSMGSFKKIKEVITDDSGCFSFSLSIDVNGNYQLTSKNSDKYWGGGILTIKGAAMSEASVERSLVIMHKK